VNRYQILHKCLWVVGKTEIRIGGDATRSAWDKKKTENHAKKCKKHRVAYRCNRQNRRARHNVTSNPTSGRSFHIGNKFYANPVEMNNSNVFILRKNK